MPKSDRVAVSLPSLDKWFTLGLMAFRKPPFMADFPVKLLRISF